jgi:2-polyprenyl-3-methyl-5-hydroxy-6-metoxy-1,4-benzoquinol methylase
MSDTRIQNEIEHGKFLAEHNAGFIWNWETPAGRIRWNRRVNMLCSKILAGKKILELGCGTGYFTKELVKTGGNITAIDISPDLINVARSKVSAKNVEFRIENAYDMYFSDNQFDSIIGSSVLHHLDINRALKECFRVLRKGGTIYFTEPNMLNPQIALQKNIPWLKKKLGDSPDETAFFRWSLRMKLLNTGFNDVKIIPFDFLHPKIPPKLINLTQRFFILSRKNTYTKRDSRVFIYFCKKIKITFGFPKFLK